MGESRFGRRASPFAGRPGCLFDEAHTGDDAIAVCQGVRYKVRVRRPSVMLPLIKPLSDGHERTMREVTSQLAESFRLSSPEREEGLLSGEQAMRRATAEGPRPTRRPANHRDDNPAMVRPRCSPHWTCRRGERSHKGIMHPWPPVLAHLLARVIGQSFARLGPPPSSP